MSDSNPSLDQKINYELTIRDWLTEYKSLSKVSLGDYASKIMDKENVIIAFHRILYSSNYSAVLELVQSGCHQLFEFYRSGNKFLKIFVISLFPSIVGAYLRVSSLCLDESSELSSSLGTLLLSIYNLLCGALENISNMSLFSESGIDIPDINHSSVYHDPMAYPFSERILSSHQKKSAELVCAKLPFPTTHTSIIPSNRSKIMYTIMSSYLDNITSVPPSSLSHVCKLCFYVGAYGFPWQQMMLKTNRSKRDRRMVVEPEFSIIILRCVYVALYNNHRTQGVKAVQSMQKRARYELSAQVLLLCNAILNSAYHDKSHVSKDAPLGVGSAVTPMLARSSSKRAKQAVTAKSIKHHKWLHANEEVSGDYTESLMHQDLAAHTLETIASGSTIDTEESSKVEKSSLSPAKLLKARIKRNVPFPSTSPSEKPRSLSIQGNEKKSKKSLGGDTLQEQRSRTPSGGQAVEFPIQKSSKLSSTSVPSLKQLSIDDTSRRSVDRSHSMSKGDLELAPAKAHDPLILKLPDGNTTNLKKSKSDKKSKSNNKSGKDSEKEMKNLQSDRLKTPTENVPLLDNSEENHFSLTTPL